ncbi:MAG: hypothetical protein AB1716_23265 [Planctomycetota bacterium]
MSSIVLLLTVAFIIGAVARTQRRTRPFDSASSDRELQAPRPLLVPASGLLPIWLHLWGVVIVLATLVPLFFVVAACILDESSGVPTITVVAGVLVLCGALISMVIVLRSVARVLHLHRATKRADAGRCITCSYDLRGQHEHRCPECGCATESLEKEECQMGP